MSGHIFISYRSRQSSAEARRLRDILSEVFGSQSVLIDEDAFPVANRREKVERQVAASAVMIVLIDKGWLHAPDASGERLLSRPEDPMRLRIAEALRQRIPVLPVLLDGAEFLHPEDLPADIRNLAFFHAKRLSAQRFEEDARAISFALRPILKGLAPMRSGQPGAEANRVDRKPLALALLLGIAVASAAYFFAYNRLDEKGLENLLDRRIEEVRRSSSRSNLDLVDAGLFYSGKALADSPLAASTAGECQRECKRQPGCGAFSYSEPGRLCHLMQAATGQMVRLGAVSGRNDRSPLPGFAWFGRCAAQDVITAADPASRPIPRSCPKIRSIAE